MATSTEDLQGLIRQARDAAAELLSEDSALGQIAFREILGHLLSERQPAATNGGAAPAVSRAAATSDIDDAFATEEQRAWAVAQFFQIGIDEVRDLFDLGDAEPFLQVGNKQLNKQKSAATREIVLLVCGARTALGFDTGTEHIREAADRHGRLDLPNFMRTLGAMEQIALRGSPGSGNRLVRLKAIGVEAARKLASKLTS